MLGEEQPVRLPAPGGMPSAATSSGRRRCPRCSTPRRRRSCWRSSEAAILELAEHGELPGRRIGGAWRFSRGALLAWLGGS